VLFGSARKGYKIVQKTKAQRTTDIVPWAFSMGELSSPLRELLDKHHFPLRRSVCQEKNEAAQ
jgi:hypothetical protein